MIIIDPPLVWSLMKGMKSMFDSTGYPLEEYIEVDDDKVEFPKEVSIAFAVCSKTCGAAEPIVDGSTQVCQYCGTVMLKIKVKKYRLVED